MPILDEKIPEGMTDIVMSKVPEWIFEHTWVGYQKVRTGFFFYRLPTFRECYQYYTSYPYHPYNATIQFLKRIAVDGLGITDRLKPPEVGDLVKLILEEHFPRDEKTIDRVEEQANMFQTNLMHILETHTRMVGDSRRIWDMNMQEASEMVGLSQAITGQSLRGNDGKQKVPSGNRSRPGGQTPRTPEGMHQANRGV